MSKKFIPVVILLTFAGFFLAYTSWGRNDNEENPRVRYTKVLRNVGIILEQGHFSPKKIDDAFSATVLKKFLEDLDGEKNILLKSDIASFRKYNNRIDDEIRGSAEIESFFAVNDVYNKRSAEVAQLYVTLLAKPFDFTTNESVVVNNDLIDFAADATERSDRWRKRVKFITLAKYSELLEDREKKKDTKDFKIKADSTLEREARDFTRRQLDRFFTTKKNRETGDENFTVFVNAIAGTMDPHTDYFPPVDLRSFNESMKGSFFGIGAQLKDEDGKIKIASLVTGGPAWKTGEVKENDEIVKVAQGAAEPIDVTGYSVPDAVKLIRGENGSEVRLTFRRIDGTSKVITLKREKVQLEEVFVRSAIINGANKIGYIYLPEFYANFQEAGGSRCAVDVAREIQKLKKENVEGIVMDLRGNGGGSLYDVVQIVGLFVEDGPVVQVKGRDEKAGILRDRDREVQYSGPLAVLIDETSASASEIFAAAIQDYKRGIVIGSTSSYGKGTVQRNIPLNPESENPLLTPKQGDDLGSLKLTLQKFYRINGGATQLRGVTPDVILPDRLEHLKFREKEMPNALSWDEIPRAEYKTWQSSSNMSAVIASANAETSTNTAFNKIKANVEWLGKNYNRDQPLRLADYRASQKELRSVVKEIDSAYKLKTPMSVSNLTADVQEFASTKEKTDRNKVFIKRVGEDIYIDESVRIVQKMIMNDNVAKQN